MLQRTEECIEQTVGARGAGGSVQGLCTGGGCRTAQLQVGNREQPQHTAKFSCETFPVSVRPWG